MAGTSAFEGSRSSKVVPLIVAAFIASLNVAVTFEPVAMPLAPLAGVVVVTVGGVVSGPTFVMNTTSTR